MTKEKRIKVLDRPQRRIDPQKVAKALGAKRVGKVNPKDLPLPLLQRDQHLEVAVARVREYRAIQHARQRLALPAVEEGWEGYLPCEMVETLADGLDALERQQRVREILRGAGCVQMDGCRPTVSDTRVVEELLALLKEPS